MASFLKSSRNWRLELGLCGKKKDTRKGMREKQGPQLGKTYLGNDIISLKLALIFSITPSTCFLRLVLAWKPRTLDTKIILEMYGIEDSIGKSVVSTTSTGTRILSCLPVTNYLLFT